jgi:nitrite reductase/ring-hydroxylating ferredoxin subunit
VSAPDEHGDYVVGPVGDIPEGTRKLVRIRNIEIGIFNVGGEFYALRNICPHQFGPICEGPTSGEWIANAGTGWRFHWHRDGEVVVCPWHGLEFDIASGECLSRRTMQVPRYPVRVVDGEIRLSLRRAPAAG